MQIATMKSGERTYNVPYRTFNRRRYYRDTVTTSETKALSIINKIRKNGGLCRKTMSGGKITIWIASKNM